MCTMLHSVRICGFTNADLFIIEYSVHSTFKAAGSFCESLQDWALA